MRDLESLGEQIAEEVAHLDAAHHRMLTKLRVFDQGGGYVDQGFRTCAQWLSWRVGWTTHTAREHVRVANALGALPLIDGAFARGQISYSKVRAITRVATAENEATLLDQAKLLTGFHLEILCRKYAAVQRHDDDISPKDDVDRRYVMRRDTPDGMVIVEACLHPEEAALLWASIQRVAVERCRAKNVSAETSADADASAERPADAVVAVADRAGGADVSASSAEPGAARERAHPAFDRADALVQIAEEVMRGSRPNRSPTELMISIPIETLRHDASTADVGCCADGTAISMAAARRLACDAGIVPLVENERGDILSIGRKSRTISGSMKRAMLRRDQTCRFPGCQARPFLEGHHMQHWAEGGETKLSNLVSVCTFHHRYLHEYGFTIELRDDGTVVAFDKRGRPVPEVPPIPSPLDLGWDNITRRNAHLEITADTIECWDATPVNYGELIDGLLRRDFPDEFPKPYWGPA